VDSLSGERLLQTLAGGDLGAAAADVADLWPPLKRWLVEPVEAADRWRPVLGFECGLNLRAEGRTDHPRTPEDVPDAPVFNVAVFRDFEPYPGSAPEVTPKEHGVEWWYLPDAEWMAMTELSSWDAGHHIGFHFWGFGDEAAAAFVEEVERTPMFRLARARRAISVRAFGLDDAPDGLSIRRFRPA
jgi:hypothetical protein